jgi:DNA-binding Xre family transcriptional regulator
VDELYIKNVVPIISYGKYSKTFLNYLSEKETNSDLLLYFNILKRKWVLKSEKLLIEIDSALGKCKNKGIYYLLLSNKLDVLEVIEETQSAKKVYEQLKREFKNIPIPFRKFVGQSLYVTKSYHLKEGFKEFRNWSDQHLEDEMGIAVHINAEARTFLKVGKNKESADKFLKVSKHALKYPHPTYIISGLNNASWHLRKKDVETSHHIVKQLAWHCGYWFDDPTVLMNYLDTILVIAKMAKDYHLFFSTAEIIEYYYEKMLLIEPDCDKKYYGTIQLVRKYYDLVYNKGGRADEITNSKGIQSFLSQQIRIPRKFAIKHGLSNTSLYRIIKGKKKHVKIETLKKILIALNPSYSFENPKMINHLLTLFKEEQYFHDNWKKVSLFSVFKLKKLFLKAYMSAVNLGRIHLSELFSFVERDKKTLKNYLIQDNENMRFFNLAVQLAFDDEQVNPFYKARYRLIDNLFTEMDKMRHITPLFRLYASIDSTSDHEQLNVYFRQYVRYLTTPWRFDVEEVMSERFSDPDYKKMLRFSKKTNLNEMYTYLCLWYYEGETRERLFDFLTRRCV